MRRTDLIINDKLFLQIEVYGKFPKSLVNKHLDVNREFLGA